MVNSLKHEWYAFICCQFFVLIFYRLLTSHENISFIEPYTKYLDNVVWHICLQSSIPHDVQFSHYFFTITVFTKSSNGLIDSVNVDIYRQSQVNAQALTNIFFNRLFLHESFSFFSIEEKGVEKGKEWGRITYFSCNFIAACKSTFYKIL